MKVGSKRRAFTLVELLVVMVVIGILTALLLPAFSRTKARTRSAVCGNHLRQMGVALQSYVQDHQYRYPYAISPPGSPSDNSEIPANYSRWNARWWFAKLDPYYSVQWTNPAYHCPGFKGVVKAVDASSGPRGSYAYNERGVRIGVPGCPRMQSDSDYADPETGVHITFPPGNFGLGPRVATNPARSTSEAAVVAPSEMFAIGESRFLSAQLNGDVGGIPGMLCGALYRRTYRFDTARHGKNYNQLFCDGHVAQMNPWTLFNPTNTAPMWNYDHQPHPELWVP